MASVVLESSSLKVFCSCAPPPGTAINQSAEWSRDTHTALNTHTHRGMHVCVNTMYTCLCCVCRLPRSHCEPNWWPEMNFSKCHPNVSLNSFTYDNCSLDSWHLFWNYPHYTCLNPKEIFSDTHATLAFVLWMSCHSMLCQAF